METPGDQRQLARGALAFVAALVACVAFLTLNPHLLGGPAGTRVSMDVDLSQGWTTSGGAPVSLGALGDLPNFYERGTTLQRRLPDRIESGIELNFLSKNCTLSLYYDNVKVYEHNPDPALGMPYSAHFNFAPLTSADAGKLISIEVRPVYPDTAVQLQDMRLSGTAAYIQRYVRLHGAAFLASMVVVFIGIAVIVLHLAMHTTGHGDLDLLSLGAISILLGTWSGAETLVPQLVTGQAPLIRALDYMALLFSPYPMVRFAGSLMHPRHRKRYEHVACVALVASVALTMGLAALTGRDMHVLLAISHAQLVVCAALVLGEAVSSFRAHGRSLRRSVQEANRPILVAFLLFVGCSMLDFVAFNVSAHAIADPAFFMRIGLFVLAIVLAIEAFRTSMEFMRRADHADAVEAIAYIDALTGIGNRTAWKIMRTEIDEALAGGLVDDALVCQFDVNFLKKVNDTYGHAAGDKHLKRAADTINRSFGTEGACYRTGGDEFTAILVGVYLDERLEQCSGLLELSLAEQAEMGEGEVPLSMAVGFGRVSEASARTVKAAQQLADKRMYKNKRDMKAERTE